MTGLLAAAAGWLDAASLRAWAGSDAYPIVNTVHLLGLVMLVGAIGVVDLRVAGFWRSLPTRDLSRALVPVAAAGLLILIPSGILLFAADGASLSGSWVFKVKLVLILVAIANIAAFHWLWRDRLESPPAGARAMALASLGLWLTVGTLGRYIAYSA